MMNGQRPRLADWIAGVLAGALLGAVFLGVGGRIMMGVIALAQSQPHGFTWSGSMAVVMLGAAAGAAIGTIFLVSRTLFPRHRALRVAFFWIIVSAFVARGLNPVSVLNVSIFAPLFVAHGTLMFVYWCRIRFSATVPALSIFNGDANHLQNRHRSSGDLRDLDG